jgi:hypothetical protein
MLLSHRRSTLEMSLFLGRSEGRRTFRDDVVIRWGGRGGDATLDFPCRSPFLSRRSLFLIFNFDDYVDVRLILYREDTCFARISSRI